MRAFAIAGFALALGGLIASASRVERLANEEVQTTVELSTPKASPPADGEPAGRNWQSLVGLPPARVGRREVTVRICGLPPGTEGSLAEHVELSLVAPPHGLDGGPGDLMEDRPPHGLDGGPVDLTEDRRSHGLDGGSVDLTEDRRSHGLDGGPGDLTEVRRPPANGTGDLGGEQGADLAPRGDSSSPVIWSERPVGPGMPALPLPPSCLVFSHRDGGSAGDLLLVWDQEALAPLAGATLTVHAVSRPLLGWLDGAVLVLLLLAGVLLLVAGQLTKPGETALDLGQAAVPLALFLVVPLAWPVRQGQPADVVINTLITDVACVGALWIMASRAQGARALSALAFHRVSGRDGWTAVFVGLFLAVGAVMAMPFYSGGQSDMTEMIKLSSGIMSLASLGLVSVWTEELLLRGAIYGACQKRWGPVIAILASAGVFSVLHLAQHWGNLSAWVVVSVTGLGLSLVRFATGSTLASTLAHLSYNLVLIAPSVVLAG